MKRLLRVRILVVLVALALLPAAALPFADRLRAEWAKFWEPKPQEFDWTTYAQENQVLDPRIFLCPTDHSALTTDVDEFVPLVDVEPADAVDRGDDADARRRAFFEAVRRGPSDPRPNFRPAFETLDDVELIDVDQLREANSTEAPLPIPLEPRRGA